MTERRKLGCYLDILAGVPSSRLTWMNMGLLDQDAPPYATDPPPGEWRRCLNLVRQVLSGLELRGARFLDVGCGRGGLCRYVEEQGAQRVTGLDILFEQVQWCARTHPRVRFVNADACALPFGDDAFDVITSIESAAHYADKDQFFSSAYRCLRSGGVFAAVNYERDGDAGSEAVSRLERAGFLVSRCEDLTAGVLRSIDAWTTMEDDFKQLGCDAALAARIRQKIDVDLRALMEEHGFRFLAWQAVAIKRARESNGAPGRN